MDTIAIQEGLRDKIARALYTMEWKEGAPDTLESDSYWHRAADAVLKIPEIEAGLGLYLASIEMQWQPIETALKDGTPVIVFCPDNHPEEQVMCGQWYSYAGGFWGIHIDDQRIEPTHWMPLPAPPENLASDDKPS